jgi:hypothetical protein
MASLELDDIFGNDILGGVASTAANVAGGRAAQRAAQTARGREDVHRGQVAEQLRLGISGPQGTTRSTDQGLATTFNSPTQRQFDVTRNLQTGLGSLGADLAQAGGRIDPFASTLPGPAGGGPGRSLDTARQVVQGDRARQQTAIQDAINDAVTQEIQRTGPPGTSTNFGSTSGKLGTTLQRLANANLIGQEQDAYNLYDTWLDQAQARTIGQANVPGQLALAPNQAFPNVGTMSDVTQGAQVMAQMRPTTQEIPDQTTQQLFTGIGDVLARRGEQERLATDPLRNALIRNIGNQVVDRSGTSGANPIVTALLGSAGYPNAFGGLA